MRRRSDVLELAVLGLLHEGPRHGYELRKDLDHRLGLPFAVSYGSLYPTLRYLLSRGLTEQLSGREQAGGAAQRTRVVYRLTAQGRQHFQTRLCRPASDACEDTAFAVHFAFFAQAGGAARLRVLQARRQRTQQHVEEVRDAMAQCAPNEDRYRRELRRYGLECVERELRWLDGLIASEHDESQRVAEPWTGDDRDGD